MDGMLSQEEINALLGEMSSEPSEDVAQQEEPKDLLTDVEKDAVGEISNISMGTAATTLATLVNDVVNITTPRILYSTLEEVSAIYNEPSVYIHISYIEGLDGSNVLLLKENDVKIITDLMMGGDGTNIEGEINSMHLSAISEAMNQMMGSASTSLSSMLNKKVDISPPVAGKFDVDMDIFPDELRALSDDGLVIVSFKMEIGELVNSEIMQMFPASFAREMYECFKSVTETQLLGEQVESKASSDSNGSSTAANATPQEPVPMMNEQPAMNEQPMMGQPMMGQPMMGQPMMGQPMYGYPQQNVQQAEFQRFDPYSNPIMQQENIGLIMDVPLEVTVELGRANKSIKEILDFSPGTIVELNKLAGEPVDVLVNGKLVAQGEVVVIEECFGIRITEIIKGL